ncbi:MAG TPA: hypothetical protein VLT33_00685 [Labilithrix sp.]|nr:hypothetical protein [Labilithrix sp.]
MRAVVLLFVLAGASTLLGCPPDDKKLPAPAAAPKGCEKVGQSCEFSPGKLGTCVQKDDCKTGSCFDCQSQH